METCAQCLALCLAHSDSFMYVSKGRRLRGDALKGKGHPKQRQQKVLEHTIRMAAHSPAHRHKGTAKENWARRNEKGCPGHAVFQFVWNRYPTF